MFWIIMYSIRNFWEDHEATGGSSLQQGEGLPGERLQSDPQFPGKCGCGGENLQTNLWAVAPVLESYGVKAGNRHVMKALTGYDTIRGHFMEGHDRVVNYVNNVKNHVAQKNVRCDFS